MNLYQFKTHSSRAVRRTAAYLKVTLHLFGGVAFLWTSTVQANPAGEQVVAGAAGFERVGGALTITQGTDRAVINWNSFSIGAGEITKFVQPNSSSAVLNRVITANNPSAIYGTLQANGQVYLINPAGIFIGPGGLVDTASFVASTHDVGDKEFMGGGDLNFTGSSGASIINQGRIEAKQGDVFLVARQVSNEGQIMASDGTVGMISGTEVCLHSIGPNNYKVRLIDVANDAAVQKTGNGIADVVNAGVIEAANAELESTGNYLSLAIKNTGVIRATGVMANADGTVTLTGGEGDILNTGVVAAIQKNIQGETVGGKILASAKNITTDPGSIMTAAGTEKGGEILLAAKDTVYASGKVEAGSTAGKGGKVQVTGERVALIQAGVDVSGKTGGGTVLVGGDYLGKNPDVPNAKAVVMTSDSVIRANATENGDGGKVILWSDEYTGFYGEIFARGGIEGGNGGFVETSSKDNLQAFGTVIASAVNGQGGLWLLDPSNITISGATANGSFNGASPNVFTPNANSATANVATINDSLNLGTSVTINTDGAGTQNGDITLASAISKTGGTAATLTLNASTEGASGGNIILNNTITSTTGALNVVLNASQGSITLGNNAITTLGGSVTMRGGLGITQGAGTINTGGGDLTYYNSLNLSGAAIIQTGGGDILFNAAVNGAQTLAITAGAGNIRFVGDVGSTTTRLGAITINTAANVEFVKTVRASSLLQSAGTGTTTFSGAQNYNAGAGLNVVTDTIVLNSSVTTSSSGTVTLNANDNNVAAESGTLTIGSAGDITADGVVSLTGAIGISTAGDVATSGKVINYNSATTLTGNISVATTDNSQAGGANMIFNFTLDGGFTPTLSAGTAGNILFRDVIGGINSLDSLVMTAAGASLFGVTTLNNQTYTTPLTLLDTTAASFVSTSGNINLSNGLDSLSTTQALTISAANGTVTFGSSLGSLSPFASVSVTAGTSITTQSITTQGGGITLSGPVILSASSAYDTTASGVVLTGGNITLSSTLNGTTANAQNLSLTAGTSGSISITGITGGTRALGALTIGAATDVTFGDAVTASSVNQSAASSRKTQFAAITTTPTSAGAGGNVTLLSNLSGGQAINVSGAITTTGNSTGTISQSSGAVSIIATGPTGTVSLADINTSGGSGSITGNGANAGSLTVDTQNQSITLNGLISLKGGAATISGTGGSGAAFNLGDPISLGGSTTINTTGGGPAGGGTVGTDQIITFGSTLNGAQSLELTAGAGNITFSQAVGGGTALGDVLINSAQTILASFGFTAKSLTQATGTGSTTFNGITTTGLANAVGGNVSLITAGNISVSGGTVTTSGGTSTGVGRAAGSITLNSTGGTVSLGAVTATGSVAAAASALAGGAGGAVTVSSSGNTTLTGATINTAGGFGDGVGVQGAGGNGLFNNNVVLSGSETITTGATAGNITFNGTLNGTVIGGQTLGLTAGAGDITLTGAVGGVTRLGAITISSANNVTAAAITAGSLTQTTGQGTTTFNGAQNYNTLTGLNVVTDTISLQNAVTTTTGSTGAIVTLNANNLGGAAAGTLTIAALGDITSDGAVNLTGAIGISTGGDVTTTGDVVNYNSATTLSGGVLVNSTSTAATGATITFANTLNGAQSLGLTAGTGGNVVFTGVVGGVTRLGAITISSANDVTAAAITAASLTQTTGQGTTTLNGLQNYNTAAGLNVVTDTISLQNAVTTTLGGVVTLNANNSGGVAAGTLTIGAAGDITSDGAVNLTGASGISTGGDVTTTGDVVNYNSATTLTGGVVINSTSGAATGATITFGSTLNGTVAGAQTLGLTAGTGGNVVFTGAVGGVTRLGAITISSANNVTAAAITAGSLTQTTGQGTTTFNGAQNYNTLTGLNVVTDTISLQNAVTTTTGSTGAIVTLNANNLGGAAAGTLTIAALGDITSDGAVNLTGASGISTGGDVTTTGDVVNYNSATTLSGGVLVNSTSTAATGATITFANTLNGAQSLGLTAGTGGNVVFTGVVGETIRLGAITISSANDVTAAAITAASLTQTTGQGTTTLNGLQNYNTAAGLNVVTDTISLQNAVTTTLGGVVTLNANNNNVAAGSGTLTIGASGLINSAGAVTLTGATGLTQTALATITAANNVVMTATTGGLNVNAAVTTTSGGVVTMNAAAGTLTIGSAGDITSDGAVNLTGAGGSGISTAGDVTTTGDVVNYNSGTTLTGGVAVDTTSGVPAGGGITFSSSVTGNNNLTLSAGTANSVDLLNPLNDLATLSVLSAINLGVADQNSLNFGIVNISGTLTALSANNLSQAAGTAISVGTGTSLTAGNGSNILLGQLNTFSGAISVAASSGILGSVTLADTTPIDLTGLSIGQNLSLTAAGITQNGSWAVPGVLTVSSTSGSITLDRNNFIGTLGSAQSVAGNFQLINQQSLNMTGPVTINGNTAITVAGQLVNQSGLTTPFAGTTGSTTLRTLSPFVGGSLSPVAGFSGFTVGYNGVNPGARNSIIYSVSPLTMFAPSGTVIAGVDLSGTQTGGGQLNTFFTGSDDLNWIISDFAKFNLPKVSSAGLEYTIYPKRVESETRSLPDSTLSQLKQELGRPPTIDEINRREVSLRQSDRLRSDSILERSSLDSTEEPIENAKAATPSTIEGQIPQANQGPKKVVPTENSSLQLAPPVASLQVLPDDSFQPKADERAALSELLVKERANAEVGLSIPVANSQ